MASPIVHVISASKDELQATLRATIALANERDTRVIILVSSDTGARELARAGTRMCRWSIPWSVAFGGLVTS